MMQELHSEGKTIVLITHDSNIACMAQRIVRIYDGMLAEDSEVA